MIIFQFRDKNTDTWNYIEQKDNKFYTSGTIGENEFNSLIEVLKYLQGFNVNIDDLFFNN